MNIIDLENINHKLDRENIAIDVLICKKNYFYPNHYKRVRVKMNTFEDDCWENCNDLKMITLIQKLYYEILKGVKY